MTDDGTKQPESTGLSRSAFGPLLLAILGLALGESLAGWILAGQAGLPMGARLSLVYFTFSCLLFSCLIPAFLLARILDSEAVRSLTEGYRKACVGADAGLHGLALIAAGVTVLCSLEIGLWAGNAAGRMMSPRFALVATVLATTGGFLTVGILVVWGMGSLMRLVERRELWAEDCRCRLFLQPWVVVGVAALGSAVLIPTLLPRAYAMAPTAMLLFLALGLHPRLSAWQSRLHRMAWRLVVILCIATVPALLFLGTARPSVQDILRRQLPCLSPLLALERSFVDGDGDGHSPILLGGDCDDDNASVHPGARDIPMNGVDEDCSGADAQIYVSQRQPDQDKSCISLPKEPNERMNIVFIQLDALRPDHLGLAGYSRNTSPVLDAFAKKPGTVWFKNAYTPAPSTRFAMSSVFTGRYPTGLPYDNLRGNDFRLKPQARTLAEILRKSRSGVRGYDTVGHTISFVIQHNKGVGQGFRNWSTPWPVREWKKYYGRAAVETTRAALEYLATMPDDGSRPFLLFSHYRCTHDPYIKHEAWDFGNRPIDRYDSALAYCDDSIKPLLEALEARKDYDRTMVVFFSDHGELFGEHGQTNHGNTLFETDVRIVLIARIPGAQRAVVDVPVILNDLFPTALPLAGIEDPAPSDGWSLLPLVCDDSFDESWRQRPLYLYTDLKRGNVRYKAAAVLQWPFKYLRDLMGPVRALYNVQADPGEKKNLLRREAEKTASLKVMLDAWLAHVQGK
ncbi:MAG: hypothetical protein CMH54_12485 [Myxococcales bacterium]|nr:hypothetical protein [Myxococcales bacterium]